MKQNFPKQLAVELLVITGIGLVFGLLGPFGTYEMPTVWRLSYWIIFIIIGYVIFRPISVVAKWLSEFGTIPFPLAIALAISVAGLPLAIMVGFMINGFSWNGPMLGDGFALLYVQVIGIGVGIFMLMHYLFRQEGPVIEQLNGAANITDTKPAILDRLPAGFPTDILALSVEDHYVRVHTLGRSEMILMRLADAISEVSGLDGLQVHRSWWVAKDSIISAKRDGRNLRLVLSNGLEIPVSRSNVGKLKQTGWI